MVPVLANLHMRKNYILYKDVSRECIGSCLCQVQDEANDTQPWQPNRKPIYFLTHKWTTSETNWSTVEKAFTIFYEENIN